MSGANLNSKQNFILSIYLFKDANNLQNTFF